MSKSQRKYEELKAYYKDKASVKEKELHMDLLAVRHEYVPHHLKRKFLTGVAIFGSVYLTEKLIFGKRIPRIIRFSTSLASIVFAPRVYRMIEDKLLSVGELQPVELEMLEDQQLSTAESDTTVAADPYAPDVQESPVSEKPTTENAAPTEAERVTPGMPPIRPTHVPSPPEDTGDTSDKNKTSPT